MNSSTLPAIDPNRGNLLAAGGILLASAVALINFRFGDETWHPAVHLLVALLAFVVVYGTALRSPASDAPHAYQSALALAGLALLVLVLVRLADFLLGDDEPGSGTLIWTSLIFVAVAVYSADRFRSLACALLAMLGAAVFVLAFVDKVFSPEDEQTFRWILLLLALAFAGAAVALRDGPRRGWDVQAVNAAGLMLIALASLLVGAGLSAARLFGSVGGAGGIDVGFGWELILVVGALAVIGYAVLTRERGPGYIGFIALVFALAVVAAGKDTLIGWPIVLLLAGIGVLALGLAPGAGGGRGGATRRERPAAAPPTGATREAPPGAGGPPPA